MVTLQVVFLTLLALSVASYVPNKTLVRPGMCQKKINGVEGGCVSDCRNDEECPGEKKCCRINACASSCTMPIFSDAGSIGSSVILDDRNTGFGAQSGSSRFTEGRTSFKTGTQGKTRSGLDEIGFAQDFGGTHNDGAISGQTSRRTSFISKSESSSTSSKHVSELEGLRSGSRGISQISGDMGSFDIGRGHGMGESNFIGSKKGSVLKSTGGRASSAVDSFDLQRESGFGGHGMGESSFTGSKKESVLKSTGGRASSAVDSFDLQRESGFGGHGMSEGSFTGSQKGSVLKSTGGRASSVVDTFDLQRETGFGGHGMGESSFTGSKKGSVLKSTGGRASSAVDTFDLQRESGFGGIRRSQGTSESLLRKLNGGRSTKGGSFVGASASASSAVGITSGHSSTDCHYECGKNQPCPLGKTCVQDGCHNICQIDISSFDQSTGLIDKMGGSIIRTSQGDFGTRRTSIGGSSSLLNDISGRTSGLTRLVSQSGISGLTKSVSKKICRKQCDVDADCHLGKICVTVNNCHQYCRRGPVKNNYKP